VSGCEREARKGVRCALVFRQGANDRLQVQAGVQAALHRLTLPFAHCMPPQLRGSRLQLMQCLCTSRGALLTSTH